MNAEQVVAENRALKQKFTEHGLDPSAVWQPTPSDLRLENAQLSNLLRWVEAYRACPERALLEELGLWFPPVEPDSDPESDWVLFERWIQGKPTCWRFSEEHEPLPAPESMTEVQVEAVYDELLDWLADHGIDVAFGEHVSARAAFTHLRETLPEETFQYAAPASRCVLTGCSGDCAACFQREGCEVRAEIEAPEVETSRFARARG